MTNLKAIERNFAEYSLPAKGVSAAKDVVGPVRLIPATFDQPLPAKQRKSRRRSATNFAQSDKSRCSQPKSEVEAKLPIPTTWRFLKMFLKRINENLRWLISEGFSIK